MNAARMNLAQDRVEQLLERVQANVEWLPSTAEEAVFDQELAQVAVRLAR